jgi:DNA-binding transcriptional LysR family regulator
MRIQTLRALIKLHQLGSIRAAAEQLHISQPALTLAIQQLENELGCQLLVRSKQGVSFTSYGKALLPRANLIVSESVRANEEIAQMRGDLGGHVKLATSPAVALSILPQALRPFMIKFPNVQIHCIEATYPSIGPELRDGRLDFAVTPFKREDLEPWMQSEAIYESEVVVVVNKDHPLATAHSLKELQSARWVHATVSRGPGAVIEEVFKSQGMEPPTPVMIFESLLALPEVVANTDLLATLPKQIYEQAQVKQKLRIIPIQEKIPTLNISILSRSNEALTPAANELLGWIRHISLQ